MQNQPYYEKEHAAYAIGIPIQSQSKNPYLITGRVSRLTHREDKEQEAMGRQASDLFN